jgi:mannose-1-phosphate guanylyltransferase
MNFIFILGPNVSVGPGVHVGAGVRLRESIVLADAHLEAHCCVLHAVIGWRSRVGMQFFSPYPIIQI